MVEAFNQRDIQHYAASLRSLTYRALIGSVAIAGAVGGGIYPILWILDEPTYYQDLHVFWILLGASVVAAIGLVPHYALYACRADWTIIGSVLLGLCISLIANSALVPQYGQVGAAIAYLSAMTLITVVKTVAWQLLTPHVMRKTY